DGVGHRDAEHPRRLRGEHTVGRVLDRDRLAWRNTEAVERRHEEIRRGLDQLDVVAAPDALEQTQDAESLEMLPDPALAGARGDARLQADVARRRRQLRDARQDRLLQHELAAPAHPLVEHLLRQRSAESFLEVGARVERRIRGADGLHPAVEGQLLAVRRVNLQPRPVDRFFRVQDQAVEVEDDRPQHGCHPHTKGLVSPHISVPENDVQIQSAKRSVTAGLPAGLIVALPGFALVSLVAMLVILFGFLDASHYTTLANLLTPDPAAAAGTVSLAGGAEGVTLSIVILVVFYGIQTTSSRYSPRIIDIFTRNPFNALVFTFALASI